MYVFGYTRLFLGPFNVSCNEVLLCCFAISYVALLLFHCFLVYAIVLHFFRFAELLCLHVALRMCTRSVDCPRRLWLFLADCSLCISFIYQKKRIAHNKRPLKCSAGIFHISHCFQHGAIACLLCSGMNK